ncbi:MAG: MoaD/ThiS family protein [Aeoliella sp.]
MQIRISYATQIRQLTGASSEMLTLEESSSVQDLVDVLCNRHGDDLRAALCESGGQLRRSLILCINDQHVLDVDQQRLTDGDELLIMSALSGG